MDENAVEVEVAYALPDKQRLIRLVVPKGSSALEAVKASGILTEFPEIDTRTVTMGIFSRILNGKTNSKPADYELRSGDRVEIYRPLTLDPKQARLLRARKKR